ncbi:hypothetical protein ACFQI7_31580 [Paenibacillus allorhizosphaerae]|uniref:SHOCT domain-containing protein n=1 Tax=Paenibacillus allorhizosphaerae TaxID=2849866 RepID=A0ABM8VPZ0_9BACL|nr:hypothetical protein [Paenibacillus allorhizosphaerae]CAG7653551.1 hypothetical protein PAECIP111802_05517 [Paenibacillus allorhizosphaerae]
MFAISAMSSAFAAEPSASVSNQAPGKHAASPKKGATLEQLAAEKGVTIDELKAQMEQERQAKLEQLAAEKGITVDEKKAQLDKKRGNRDDASKTTSANQ